MGFTKEQGFLENVYEIKMSSVFFPLEYIPLKNSEVRSTSSGGADLKPISTPGIYGSSWKKNISL